MCITACSWILLNNEHNQISDLIHNLTRALPEQFLDVPYAPFGKSDRLGRAADFTAPLYYQTKVFREWLESTVELNHKIRSLA